MYSLLIVEDDIEINQLLAEFLSDNGYQTISQYDGYGISNILHQNKVDLILLDIMLPYRSGDLILANLRKHRFRAGSCQTAGRKAWRRGYR